MIACRRPVGCPFANGTQASAAQSAVALRQWHGHRRSPWTRAGRPGQRASEVAAAASPKDRLLSAVPYLLPLCDGYKYGKFLMLQYPIFQSFLAPFTPFLRLYFSSPFVGILTFVGIYFGITRNSSLPRSVRFNAMQAVLLDIILIVPQVLEGALNPPLNNDAFMSIYITMYNSIFLYVLVGVVYGVVACLTDQVPRIPLVADAADQQVRM